MNLKPITVFFGKNYTGKSTILNDISKSFNQELNKLHILNQPEARLHPSTHANLSQSIVNTFNFDNTNWFLIETHSENLILFLRYLVAKSELNKDNIVLYYTYIENENYLYKEIHLDDNGKPDYWPKGIFAEDYEIITKINQVNYNKTL